MTRKHILMVLTSHDLLGDTGEKTGFWLEEFAAPYYAFLDAGADVTLASPKGGQPPIDPKSALPESQTAATRRFAADAAGTVALAATRRIASLDAGDYHAIFLPGGHGPMWDLAVDAALGHLIEAFDQEAKPIGAVCHGPAGLLSAKRADGQPLVAGRRVAAFTNSEEAAVGLSRVVPFLLADRLQGLGATIDVGPDFAPHVATDGNLVTGQNPASSEPAAHALLALLGRT